ncbi:hypothetical protein ACFQJ5_12010 [Halomicroarcula sp. GCM10025324]|uniref:hypothetical protein n=1 Tax=Haloarcula TaxID=2237 RepID=UPI0023E816D3|nr:hypothetical protein [Halomicroarcula sp. ZS-22-S1]
MTDQSSEETRQTGESGRDGPVRCPVCGADFESVSVHDEGLMVNLLDNERFRRVCFQPVSDDDGAPLVRFFHHTHEQAGTASPGEVGGRVP